MQDKEWKCFLQKKTKQSSKYEHTKKKGTWAEVDHAITSPLAFSGLVFMRHEGPADEGFSAVQT